MIQAIHVELRVILELSNEDMPHNIIRGNAWVI